MKRPKFSLYGIIDWTGAKITSWGKVMADKKYPPDSPDEPEDVPFEADEEQENKRVRR